MALRRKPLKYEPVTDCSDQWTALGFFAIVIVFGLVVMMVSCSKDYKEYKAEASEAVCTKQFVKFKDTGEIYEIDDWDSTVQNNKIAVYFTEPIEICDGIYAKKMTTGSENVYIFTRCFEDEQTNQEKAE